VPWFESVKIRQLISCNAKNMLPTPPPQPAAIFDSKFSMDWLNQMAESNAISTAILAVIHPHLYDAGQQTLNYLRHSPEINRQDVLNRWNSVFSGISVIYNGNVGAHRDNQSRHNWYDLLITLGRYHGCNLLLPGVGLSLQYGPGTVVGLSGMALEHEVTQFEGERVCFAHFMRDRVHEWARVPGGSWMKTNYYE